MQNEMWAWVIPDTGGKPLAVPACASWGFGPGTWFSLLHLRRLFSLK